MITTSYCCSTTGGLVRCSGHCIHPTCVILFKAPIITSSVSCLLDEAALGCAVLSHVARYIIAWFMEIVEPSSTCRVLFVVIFPIVLDFLGGKWRSTTLTLYQNSSFVRFPHTSIVSTCDTLIKNVRAICRQRTVKPCFQTAVCLPSMADVSARIKNSDLVPVPE